MSSMLQNEQKSDFRYFAFISYSRKDIHWAKWLQRKLETYRLPAKLRKDHADLPPRIVPVFRDQTDLAGTVLEEALQRELEESQYLIVICSPNSAASFYVDLEIRHFLSLGRKKQIIPFIVEGGPFSKEPQKECFPEAIRQIKPSLLGISALELGKRRAFLHVVSTLLHIRPDEMINRDKTRRIIQGTVLGAVLLLLLAAGSWALWYNTPHSKYYNAYTYQHEIPVGIYELSGKQRSTASDCYRITTLRGNVICLETVNSLGTVIDPVASNGLTEYPRMEFKNHDNAGRPTEIEQYNAQGTLISRKLLSYHDSDNTSTIDYRKPSNSSQVQAMSADMFSALIGDTALDTKSEITRQVNTYDENGLLIQTMYQKSDLGYPACDSNGAYGKRFEYNENNQILRVSNLNEHGEIYDCKYGWATEEFTYDEKGSEICEQYYAADGSRAMEANGYFAAVTSYDDNGNADVIQYLDTENQLCNRKQGYAQILAFYNESGFMTEVTHLDTQQLPAYDEMGIHAYRYQYDELGRNVGIGIWGPDDLPTYSSEFSWSSVQMELDADGQILSARFFDAEGNPACYTAMGIYGMRSEYDAYGNQSSMYYLDANGQAILCKNGYASYHYINDSNGTLLRCEYRDERGQLIRCSSGYAAVEYEYDIFGNKTLERLLDENDQPCSHVEGYSEIWYEYEDGNLICTQYYDTAGQPTLYDNQYFMCRMEYDKKGNRTRISYYDTNGDLTIIRSDYAFRVCNYDEYGNLIKTQYYGVDAQPCYNDQGYSSVEYVFEKTQPVSEKFFDTDGQPMLCESGYHEVRVKYDVKGNKISGTYYDAEGQPGLFSNAFHKCVRDYDAKGNCIRMAYYDVDGKLVNLRDVYAIEEYDFDAYGNKTEVRYYNKEAEPCYYKGGYSIIRYDYRIGNLTSEKYFDTDGQPILCEEGYHECRMDYDVAGNCIRLSYYDADSRLVMLEERYAIAEQDYDGYGNLTAIRYYNADAQPCFHQDGYSIAIYQYAGNNRVSETYFGPDGAPVLCCGKFHECRMEYDSKGDCSQWTYYDLEGNVVKQYDNLLYNLFWLMLIAP